MDNNDQLNVSGSNINGELGINSNCDELDDMIIHPYFMNKEIHSISNSISGDHSFIYASNVLYGFGSNECRQLGSRTSSFCSIKPIEIKYPFDSGLKLIKCGDFHSLFLTCNGNVYGCGMNNDGQLSYKYKDPRDNNSQLSMIQNIFNSNNIQYINCTHSSSYVLFNDYILKSFGCNDVGQLGTDMYNTDRKGEIKLVLKGIKIDKISCGESHVACLTKRRHKLYMFGKNYHLQCGCSRPHKNFFNRHIININNIIDVHCGNNHTIIKTENNQFYSFGNNESSQLLLNIKQTKLHKPTLVSTKYIHTLTQSTNIIIDLLPANDETFIIQESTAL